MSAAERNPIDDLLRRPMAVIGAGTLGRRIALIPRQRVRKPPVDKFRGFEHVYRCDTFRAYLGFSGILPATRKHIDTHMTDYYSLIARTVDRLEKNTGETRRRVYEHVRPALRDRLNALDPPLSGRQIIAECVSLERAIHKVEREAPRPWRTGDRDMSQGVSSRPATAADT
jgi:hypothetical protein